MQEIMQEAGKEEKRLAEEICDFHERVPAIIVIVDGGWSKRSHRHSYNAKSGMGILLLAKQLVSLYTLVSEISTAQLAPRVSQKRTTPVSRTGKSHHARWRHT